jgi:hypothetical protein
LPAAVLLAAVLAWGASVAAAAEGAPAPNVAWDAPRECPDLAAVSARLEDVLGGELSNFGRDWQVSGRVSGSAGRWMLVLELREPGGAVSAGPRQRVLRAQRCDELVEAAAVAIAIALGDAMTSVRSSDEAAVVRADVAPSSSMLAPSSPTAAPGAAGSGARSGQVALPPSSDGASGSAVGVRNEQHLDLALGVVLDSASVAGWAVGGNLGLKLWLGDLGLGVYGVWLPSHSRTIAPAQGADFSLLAAGVQGCYRAWGDVASFSLEGCAGFELGRFSAESYGLRAASDSTDLWLAPSLGVDLRGRILGPLAAMSRIEVLLPLRRQAYLVDLDQPVHDIPALTLRWSLAVAGDLSL